MNDCLVKITHRAEVRAVTIFVSELSVLNFFDVDSSGCAAALRFAPRAFDCCALLVPVLPGFGPRHFGPSLRASSDFAEVKGASVSSAVLTESVETADMMLLSHDGEETSGGMTLDASLLLAEVKGASATSLTLMIVVPDPAVVAVGALVSLAVVTDSIATAGVMLSSHAGETSGGMVLDAVRASGTLTASSG